MNKEQIYNIAYLTMKAMMIKIIENDTQKDYELGFQHGFKKAVECFEQALKEVE